MTDQPEKLDLRSLDLTEEKKQELLRLFPEIRTEGGQIDFERLKLTLGEMVDVGKERYGMNWPGKADCFRTIQVPSTGTLIPCPEESVNFDTTENLIIEGDNLEVLKLLQKAYLGKVKMIYIDPPYNTGNDFIYPDNYTESLQTYLEYTKQVDSQGKKFATNTDTDGRFHSRWMNMMYPRLYLARNLLRDDGIIFISIDDNEVENLKKICNEIFGEQSFLSCVLWQKRTSPDARTALGAAHDYILCYVKTLIDKKCPLNLVPLSKERLAEFKNPDNDPRGIWASVDVTGQTGHATSSQYFEIGTPSGIKYFPPEGRCWAISEHTFLQLVKENRVWFGKDGNSRPRIKQFLSETKGMTTWTWWTNEEVGHNQEATKELSDLIGQPDIFDNPKPIRLIKKMLYLSTSSSSNDIIVDFFAGSGTTAQAVLELNKSDNGNRKFILVQLPENIDPENKDQKSALSFCKENHLRENIAEISKERVRRVIKKLNDADADQLPLNISRDCGFRDFKLVASNFKPWNAQVLQDASALTRQLELHIDHIREDRSSDDILYEILLKSGFPLITTVEKLNLAGKQVFSVAGGTLLICLEPELTMEVIRAMAAQKPERVVCLDAGFEGNDQLKANAVQIFKTQGIPSFKTV
jgi:adenine-specific DNA-methyltransferase